MCWGEPYGSGEKKRAEFRWNRDAIYLKVPSV